MNLKPVAVCGLAALLCSCASTSVKHTWTSPEHRGGPFTKAAVIAIDERVLVREGFENRLVKRLRERGASASTTFDRLPLPQIRADKDAAAERLRSDGAEVVVIMRMKDVTTRYRESQPGGPRWAETVTGFEMDTWYGYYTVAYGDMSPTYGNLKQNVYLETGVFDLKTSKRIWAGFTETVITDKTDKVAAVDQLIPKVIEAMRQDGICP